MTICEWTRVGAVIYGASAIISLIYVTIVHGNEIDEASEGSATALIVFGYLFLAVTWPLWIWEEIKERLTKRN